MGEIGRQSSKRVSHCILVKQSNAFGSGLLYCGLSGLNCVSFTAGNAASVDFRATRLAQSDSSTAVTFLKRGDWVHVEEMV
jgi:hypothetical protein